MNINRCNVDSWKNDIEESVNFYNRWFLDYAPKTFIEARKKALKDVRCVFKHLKGAPDFQPLILNSVYPVLLVMRQMTCPPLARDRLAGLANVKTSFIQRLEEKPMANNAWNNIKSPEVLSVIQKLLDNELFSWLTEGSMPVSFRRQKMAEQIVADRLCGALTDPLIRNEQEKRQLNSIASWLEHKGYHLVKASSYEALNPGEFAFHLTIKASLAEKQEATVGIPVDVAIQPLKPKSDNFPIIIEAKSAGDFTNVNKRRKEEAQKVTQLKRTFGQVDYVLFLCGYFDTSFLGYEAAEGLDWIWEHRIDDMGKLGL